MTSNAPDLYRQRLAHAKWTWMEAKACRRLLAPLRRKDRASGRAEKRKARQDVRAEVAGADMETREMLSADPCENGTCPFCHDGGRETDFERTRMAAAQRGAI